MSFPAASEVQRLTLSDLAENVALSRAVGWSDVESEWRVLYGAAEVFGMRDSNFSSLRAQVALANYGTAGSLAKMVVHPEFQRRGWASALVEHVLGRAAELSLSAVGLVATPQGQPLYLRHGFQQIGETITMLGEVNASANHIARCESVDDVCAFEREIMACDRSRMLRARHAETVIALVQRDEHARVQGFVFATEQGPRRMIGPLIARSEDIARELVTAACSTAGRIVRVDVPAEHERFRCYLRALGLVEHAVRAEMAWRARLPWRVPERFALAAQAWG